ncbi:hypothetical protein FRC07_013923, partial [Ceratobasidium sp. 392]
MPRQLGLREERLRALCHFMLFREMDYEEEGTDPTIDEEEQLLVDMGTYYKILT